MSALAENPEQAEQARRLTLIVRDLFNGDQALSEGELIRRIQERRGCSEVEAHRIFQWLKVVGAITTAPGLGWCDATGS